jgi:acetyl-CoA carboxylase carboxyl transferase subunit alpha
MKFLPFEQELEKIYLAMQRNPGDEQLKRMFDEKLKEIYTNLQPYEIVEIARHPERPHTEDYISNIITDFVELHGDRYFGDDPAMITGIGRLNETVVGVIGHRKGSTFWDGKS